MKVPVFMLCVVGVLAAGPALAADVAQGEALHKKHCVACHASMTGGKPDTLYTREKRRVSSLSALDKQVRRCEQSLGLRWFDDQVDSVTAYLDERFYHFGK